MYICNYFAPAELVAETTIRALEKRGLDDSFVYALMDSRLLRLLDYLRSVYGAAIVNNWSAGGARTESGLRIPGMSNYSEFSQHSYGRAADVLFMNVTAEEIRYNFADGVHDGFLISNQIMVTLENGVSWLHADVRNAYQFVNFFDSAN